METTLAQKLANAGFTMIEVMAIQASILFTVESSMEDTETFKRLFGELSWDALMNLRQDIQD